MRIVIDTNVILDIILEREPFYGDSYEALEKAIIRGDKLFIASTSVTDIYYVTKKQKQSKEFAMECVKKLSSIITFAEANGKNLMKAFRSKLIDYEDAVIDEIADSIEADVIITRNLKDFIGSKTECLTPNEFVSRLKLNKN